MFTLCLRQIQKILFSIILLTCLIILNTSYSGERITVVMTNGDKIAGELVKNDSKNIYLYFVGKVITINKKKILRIIKSKKKINTSIKSKEHKLYKTANLPLKNFPDLVEELGQAIVLVKTPSGLGTGWFCNKDGYLITNYHVIQGEKSITVTIFPKKRDGFSKKTYKKVKIIALNASIDLALLKIEEKIDIEYPQLYLGDSTKLKDGDRVLVIGNPLGLIRSSSQGIISKASRNYRGRLYLQTTAPISPGNSGGPLLNERGEVIGVINMGIRFMDGLGFAIPSKYIKEFLDNIEAFAYDNDNPNNGFQYMETPINSTDQRIKFDESEFIKSDFDISNLNLVDLNGDHIKEIVYANNNKAEIGIIRLFQNGESPQDSQDSQDLEDINHLKESQRFTTDFIPVSSKIFSLAVADINNDQLPDIIFYGDIDGLSVLTQKKDGSFHPAVKIDDIQISRRKSALKVLDINNDGKNDIFVLGDKSFTIFYGGKNKKEFPLNNDYINKIKHFEIRDVNQDGLKDIIFFVSDKHYAIFVRLQNKSGQLVDEIPIPSHISGPVAPYIENKKTSFLTLDNGINRIRELRFGYSIKAEKANVFPDYLLSIPFNIPFQGKSDIALGDIDGDKKVEILFVDQAKNEFVLLDKDNEGYSVKRSPSPNKVSQFKLYCGKDSKPIVITHSQKDKLFGASKINNGKISFPRPINTKGQIHFMKVVNLDNIDYLVWVEQLKSKYFLRYTSLKILAEKVYNHLNRSIDIEIQTFHFNNPTGKKLDYLTKKPERFSFADFNNDGKKDLVVYWTYSEKESLFLMTKDNNMFSEIIKGQKILGNHTIIVEDINNDGKKDILLAMPGFVRILKVDKKDKLFVEQQINWKYGTLNDLVVYSKQKNKSPLFLALTGKKMLLVKYDMGKKEFAIQGKKDLSGLQLNSIHVGNITENNSPDIIALGNSTVNILSNSNKRLNVKSTIIMNTKTEYYLYWNIFTSDLDQDGKDEILLFDSKKAMFEIYRKSLKGKLNLVLRRRLFEKTTFQNRRTVRFEIPREIQIGDVDGNKIPDFVCILQDRVAIYLQDTKKGQKVKPGQNHPKKIKE